MKNLLWITDLSKQQRIDIAKTKVNALVNRVCIALETRASNKVMSFPKGHEGPSSAAVCFNQLLASQLKFEALMLASIWDRPAKDRNSIPTVVALVNDHEILVMLKDKAGEQYRADDPEGDLAKYYQNRRNEEVALFDKRWSRSQETCNRVTSDPNFSLLREFRDYEIAHTISGEGIEIDRDKIRLAEPFWKDTIECVGDLNSALTLSGFDFDHSEQMNAKNAKAFWGNLAISVSSKA